MFVNQIKPDVYVHVLTLAVNFAIMKCYYTRFYFEVNKVINVSSFTVNMQCCDA